MSAFRTFIVPYDFSSHAQAALATARELAEALDAKLHLVHVIHVPRLAYAYAPHATAAPLPIDTVELRNEAQRSLDQVAEALGGAAGGVETHVVEGASIDETVRAVAEEQKADLIVMGTHGRTGLAHVFLGSVAERTLRKAPCPVLTVRGEEEEGS